ncbi:tRNA (guanosine(37)-N1)-methyltransferase TrmD [Piscinibacter sakaiensis]|uniref:tRNA (guanosine(37)-N1)-methyltransferase TrmD n=1 Tax=Piscinibacter sakaiensis TaxID=1547922 RepID=UPI003AAFC5A0
MRFDIVTLFPELFAPHLAHGITRRAFESGQVGVHLWQLRDFADNNYRRVDDRPYGGGPGMLMLAEPLERALAKVRQQRAAAGESAGPVVHFSPTGRVIDQALVRQWANGPGAILLCGRYEGIDQRFLDRHVDVELSLGDFVLSGGELPALALLDAVARLQPGVLGDQQSHLQDSFSDGLLDCPHFSRPEVLPAAEGFPEAGVPAVLSSGNHREIARWRREQSLLLSARRRPDLIEKARADGRLSDSDEQYLRKLGL